MINQGFFENLQKASTQDVDINQYEGGISSARRALSPRRQSTRVHLQLVPRGDDVYKWVEAPPAIPGMKRSRRGTGGSASTTDVISFEKIAPSQMVEMLVNQDKKFTPDQGLFRARSDFEFEECKKFPESGNVLLFIHGTFSNGGNTLEGLKENSSGESFLQAAFNRYGKQNVLMFNHPTISVSPMLNACDLQSLIGDSKAKIDIIAHSRGGLVTRWWCETYDKQLERCRNAILVGSPLAGTGLAAPPNIRKTLSLLTSYGNALSGVTGLAATAAPILGLVKTLLSIITSITNIAAKTPLADGLLAMVPGLHAQSRVGNNQELTRLHHSNGTSERYAAVVSNFQSESPGWRFWKYFNKSVITDLAKDWATNIIFDGANDCVVDTDSMSYLSASDRISANRIFDFGTTDRVHHTNYFSQPETLAHFRKILNF